MSTQHATNENRHARKATLDGEERQGRWRAYKYEDLIKRDKISFWLKDEALEDSANLPAPEIIVEDLQALKSQEI